MTGHLKSDIVDSLFTRLFLSGDFVLDPYPDYEELRRLGRAHQVAGGAWVVTAYRDCIAVLRDPRFGNDIEAVGRAKGGASWREHNSLVMLSGMMLMANPPRHGTLHSRVSAEFTPARIGRVKPEIERVAKELYLGLRARGGGDFISDYADVLPLRTIHAVLGIPDSHRTELRQQTLTFNALFERSVTAAQVAAADLAVDEIRAYLSELLVYRRNRPADDLISALASASEAGAIATEELVPLLFQVYNAAYQTTMSLLGNSLWQLMRNPSQFTRIRHDASLLDSACEELVRFDPPVQSTGRHAFVDFDLDGIPVRAGDMVIVVIAAANRDPERYFAPARLDVGRGGPAGLSYGYGPHYCLGAAIANAQLRSTLQLLADPGLLIEPDGQAVRLASANMRGFAHLPIALSERAGRVTR
ncbi:putative Cytochrome P450 107B1 [Phycicoccus elongatus Lp2]|uniref:Putative Cytochrome P450 107B1 n=1 Tax=Phycicoccus elongatus Lp2 TaxID=1193181 RepID=N0E4X1_9MICO|nr:cytochrome P450 [Phycicoccus elongatus]CCH70995.1 putative Cytochrome P450 107B1 [Phycicoccus elongatus Lp2]